MAATSSRISVEEIYIRLQVLLRYYYLWRTLQDQRATWVDAIFPAGYTLDTRDFNRTFGALEVTDIGCTPAARRALAKLASVEGRAAQRATSQSHPSGSADERVVSATGATYNALTRRRARFTSSPAEQRMSDAVVRAAIAEGAPERQDGSSAQTPSR